MDTLYIVVPCYNEEEVLPETSKRLGDLMRGLISEKRVSAKSRVMLVDDGSRDKTWEIINAIHKEDSLFDGLRLSRNKGHQQALVAGLMTARSYADVTVSMDADLQDDLNTVSGMLEKYYEGCDIVYGVRSSREKDSFLKRYTAEGFYKLTAALGGEIIFNHADYRLMSRRALDALSEYGEVNLFLRGIIPMIGYKSAVIEYERRARFAGESKYSVKKMLQFAGDGITSLTTSPLRIITILGGIMILLSLALLAVFAAGTFFGGELLGWRIVLFAIILTGGVVTTCVGIVGEYIGKIYMETKRRPRYFIDCILHNGDGAEKN